MKCALKWIFGLTGMILGLFLLAVVAVLLFVDPNDYREQIADTVQDETGRTLRIDGEITFSFFPWLGLELGQLELGNAAGFAETPFAGIRRADLHIKLLPLLSMQAEIDTIALHGLTLNLHCLADGQCNWDDLTGEAAEKKPAEKTTDKPSPAKSPEQVLAALAIGGLEILDANIHWQDDTTGQNARLSNFNLRTGQISMSQPIPLQVDAQVSLNEPELVASIELSTRISLDLSAERYRLDTTRLDLELQSPLIPNDRLKLKLAADLSADLKQHHASLRNLLLQAAGIELAANVEVANIPGDPAASGNLALTVKDATALFGLAELPDGIDITALQGSNLRTDFRLDLATEQLDIRQFVLSALGLELDVQLAITQLLNEPNIRGQLRSNEFVPRQVMGKLGIEAPDMADPNTLILAKLALAFEGGMDHASLKDLQLVLDQSRLSGNLSLRNPDAPVIRYQLELDDIDLDRYLPPPSEAETSPATTAVASDTKTEVIELPLEMLRSLDLDGTLRIGKVKVMNLRSDTIIKTLRAETGLFRIHPLSANLYQGNYQGDLRFDVRQDTPRLGMDERLSGVQAGPLLKDFLGDDYASGKANLAVKLTAEGLEPMQVRRTLNGSGNFNFEDGQVKGINIGHLIRQAYALYKQQPAPPEETRQSDFTALGGSFTARNGLLTTRDLSARSPLFQVAGSGDVNLVSEKLDLRLDTTLVADLKNTASQNIHELKGVMIPITIKGDFSDPKFGVDVGSVLRARVQQAVDKKKEEVKDKVQERVDDEKKKLEQQLRDRMRPR